MLNLSSPILDDSFREEPHRALNTETSNQQPHFYSDVYLVPCYGQSLSINTGAGPSTFSYVEPLSFDVNLKNTNIQDMCAGTAEMFGIMASRIGYTLPKKFKIMHCLGGGGGLSVSQLSKGSGYYNNVINSVKTAKATCDAAGLTLNVPCFTWTQGEEDMRAGGNPAGYGYGNFDPFAYKTRLKKLIDDFNADIKSITGQKNDVLCISYQVASHTSYGRYPRIAIQQAQLANEDQRFILAKAMYDVEYNDEGTFQVHAPARTYRNMGNLYGIAIWKACVMQEKVEPFRPIYYTDNGSEILVKFSVPVKPLVLDATLVANLPDKNYGFNVYNVDEQPGTKGVIKKSGTIIKSVVIQGDDAVVISLNQSLQDGDRLTYGINGDYWQNIAGSITVSTKGEGVDGKAKSGIYGGSRGCLRDSQPIKNNNQGAVFTKLYNWCPIFEIDKSLITGISPVIVDNTADGFLYQNAPNPFTDMTVIRYSLPESAKSAFINIFDIQGNLLKKCPASRQGELSISSLDLKAGMYLYSLIIDGKAIDTKKMVLTK